ncbi:MAG: hypothetical protein U9N79_03725 [Actinomycetota bacterium]|nr:hypothetical protein [Actinomycetota bacterium]
MEVPGTENGDGLAEVLIMVGEDRVIMSYDPGHLSAHAEDFALSWSDLLDAIGHSLNRCGAREGLVHEGFVQESEVGWTGLVGVEAGDSSFWGYRQGRTVPSHLIVGTKVPTRELCLWGEWVTRDRFELLTCYPGGPAPREIHDPEIGFDQIDEAIVFWSAHAIVVDGEQS